MKRAICLLALCFTMLASSNVFASQIKENPSMTGSPTPVASAMPTPLQTAIPATAPIQAPMPEPVSTLLQIKDSRYIMTKLFEFPAGETINPSTLKEQPFKLDGYSYAYFDTAKNEIRNDEKRAEKQEVKLSTADNDAAAILEQLTPEMAFDKDGFVGTLALDHASIVTEVEGYTYKSYTINDSQTLVNLSSNDPYLVPKSMTHNGVVLNLKTVDWRANQSEAIDYNSIPTSYTAVAHYSGSYSKQVPTGYVTTAHYTGEVLKSTLVKTQYTITYLGEKLPEPTPAPTPVPTPVPTPEPVQQEQGKPVSPAVWVMGIILFLAGIVGAVAAFFLLLPNTLIFIKEGEEDYRQIGKRTVRFENPVVDLTGLDVASQEVAVYVKKRMAQKLFGRHIKTVANDFSVSCLVDKQNCDYWYIVAVPGGTDKDTGAKEDKPKMPDATKTPALTETESIEKPIKEETDAKS